MFATSEAVGGSTGSQAWFTTNTPRTFLSTATVPGDDVSSLPLAMGASPASFAAGIRSPASFSLPTTLGWGQLASAVASGGAWNCTHQKYLHFPITQQPALQSAPQPRNQRVSLAATMEPAAIAASESPMGWAPTMEVDHGVQHDGRSSAPSQNITTYSHCRTCRVGRPQVCQHMPVPLKNIGALIPQLSCEDMEHAPTWETAQAME